MSPHRLIQERLPRGPLYPWRMLVACVLLNRTRGAVGVPTALAVLEAWPSPGALACADLRTLRAVIRPCGLWRRRALTLCNLSVAWVAGVRDPRLLPGVGPYALDSWRIFVDGRLPRGVRDGKLRLYINWKKRRTT